MYPQAGLSSYLNKCTYHLQRAPLTQLTSLPWSLIWQAAAASSAFQDNLTPTLPLTFTHPTKHWGPALTF